MRGRDREICRGINVDAGEAAVIRARWLAESQAAKSTSLAPTQRCPHLGLPIVGTDGENTKAACAPCGGKLRQLFACDHPARRPDQVTLGDCSQCDYRPRPKPQRAVILTNHLSPGDVLCMSAAIYSLHRANPGVFAVAIETSADALYQHNPDVVPVADAQAMGAKRAQAHYPAIHQSDQRAIHFMQGYCEFLQELLGVRVPILTNRPRIYLSREERSWINQVREAGEERPFWVINAGNKSDFTCKQWGPERYQRVVDLLRDRVLFAQVGATEHEHVRLRGVVDLVGKTDLRQLVRLVWNSRGVLTGVSLPMHLAAALERPAVVVAGGREPVPWNSYPRQHLLHSVGALPCCAAGGCWRSRVVKRNDGNAQDASLCERPRADGVPECMGLIEPEEVAEKILRFERIHA